MSMIGNFVAVDLETVNDLMQSPERLATFLDEISEGTREADSLDIDKAWHGIHFLLTGSTWEGEAPLRWVVFAPREVGEDVGYGPARILTPAEVNEVSEALASTTADQLKARYDWKAMNKAEIYPQNWREGDEEWLLREYEELKKLYERAARQGMGIIQWLN